MKLTTPKMEPNILKKKVYSFVIIKFIFVNRLSSLKTRVVRQCIFSTVDSFDTAPKFKTKTMTDIGTWSTVDSHCQCLKSHV